MKIYPDLQQIESARYPVELNEDRQAEVYLLKMLEQRVMTLESQPSEYIDPPEFSVYYQPYINNNNPDIVIHRHGFGALIIEVKNIDLHSYRMQTDGLWQVRSPSDGKWYSRKSPLEQVATYKNLLYDYYLESAREMLARQGEIYSYISTAVYFHGASPEELYKFQLDPHCQVITQQEIENGGMDVLKRLLEASHLTRQSKFDTLELDSQLARILQPPEFISERLEEYDFQLKDFANVRDSKPGMQKVRGFAGTGKTTLLAHRAVQAQLRTHQRVLVLCFNITMVNFLHDRISIFRHLSGSPWDQYEIIHFHLFIYQKLNRLQIAAGQDGGLASENADADDWIPYELLAQADIPDYEKYAAIFIDEVQDFRYEWIKAVQRFLLPGGEMVIAGDENQNIYNLKMDESKLPRTPISGNWNTLKVQRRTGTQLSQMSIDFFHEYLASKYPEIEVELQRRLADVESRFAYTDSPFAVQHFVRIQKELNCHDQDITILSNSIHALRQIEQALRMEHHKATSTMFETAETWKEQRERNPDDDAFRKTIKGIRRSKKFNFRLGNPVKLATIHSFKGASQGTIILVLESSMDFQRDSDATDLTHELIYTAMTRPRKNLIIYDPGQAYKPFFEKYSKKKAELNAP